MVRNAAGRARRRYGTQPPHCEGRLCGCFCLQEESLLQKHKNKEHVQCAGRAILLTSSAAPWRCGSGTEMPGISRIRSAIRWRSICQSANGFNRRTKPPRIGFESHVTRRAWARFVGGDADGGFQLRFSGHALIKTGGACNAACVSTECVLKEPAGCCPCCGLPCGLCLRKS